MTELKPCMRCESELPLSAFDSSESMFCKDCTKEIMEIISNKYNAIEAALFRAKLRKNTRGALDSLRRKSS